jgi:hypothetical protein
MTNRGGGGSVGVPLLPLALVILGVSTPVWAQLTGPFTAFVDLAGRNHGSNDGTGSCQWDLSRNFACNVNDPVQSFTCEPTQGGQNSARLAMDNFGFDLSPHSVVTGLQMTIRRITCCFSGGSPVVRTQRIGFLKNTSSGVDEHTFGTLHTSVWTTGTGTVDQPYPVGGGFSMMGTTWTPQDVNSPSFGVFVVSRNEGTGSARSGVTCITATIQYNCPFGDGGGSPRRCLDQCEAKPDGTSCDNGVFCDGNLDTCQSGVCTGSTTNVCFAAGLTLCATQCNEGPQTCGAPPGTPCDDGLFCTSNDRCTAGKLCVGNSTANPCTGNPTCQSLCSEANNGTCTGAGACDDGDPCTISDTCVNLAVR